ncbi:301e68c2-3acf-4a22-ac30-d27479af670b [Thermothielavioides terrestris]|uniref:301e68c2-3acf-4a22-ac30-d27479af670b n=1 Tax=Thermothielavioides terrestris TaxID=2587410 RepID=A0A3S4BKY3_9PEZI|nr:301e68c2-3acf-4a22-ac30-d27479af670b [Thermothielavioides terrestris]
MSQNVIRLLNFPQDLAAALEAVILASWPPGLESQGPFGQSYEYKVKGSPFGHFRSQQHVGSVRLLRDVLAFLYSRRWELVAPVLCSRRYTAKDSLIFRQVAAVGAALPPVEWLSLAPAGTDKLRVVYDAPGVRLCGTESDQDHLGVLILSLKKVLQESDYFDKGDWSHDSFVFDLKGRPWQSRGEASVKMRVMLMRLLETMETHGWRLYTAFVHRTGTDELRMLDTWYFVRERGGTGKSDS